MDNKVDFAIRFYLHLLHSYQPRNSVLSVLSELLLTDLSGVQ